MRLNGMEAAPRRADNREVIDLTRAVVQVDSSPAHMVEGENRVDDIFESYARQAGLQVDRWTTQHGKPMLVVSLPGSDPKLGSVGFVHHSDVVGTDGVWKLGQPFSGTITTDDHGREVMVGRGTVDTKGPAAQILLAMKQLKASGTVLPRSMKLFVFPDEEIGGPDGAYFVSHENAGKIRDVEHWLVEGSSVVAQSLLAGAGARTDIPYLAVAQKYCLPLQLKLKTPASSDEAVSKTTAALQRLDDYVNQQPWKHLGNTAESQEMYNRMGDMIGGAKGWALKHLWNSSTFQKAIMTTPAGPPLAAANRTDFCKTDFFLSSNPSGGTDDINEKPSSATVVLQGVSAGDVQKTAGKDFAVTEKDGRVALTLPQENYHGGNHASAPDRKEDAVDRVDGALAKVRKQFPQARVVDYFTDKSIPKQAASGGKVATTVSLDLRIPIDNDRQQTLADMQKAVGPDFELAPLFDHIELDADVRRLTTGSALFQAAQSTSKDVYGKDVPVLFGNSPGSNDTRFLMDVNPKCDALAFDPVLTTEHGPHGPDESVTIASLVKGVDWEREFMTRIGQG
ncbi:MAG TPA: M20/M25/M40 family metallo-hydrolase [Candidatus Xenobia bacterium]|jgi:acetylornithine deacetylase/succinyl-diaminopimelate desuccinylase-like protein